MSVELARYLLPAVALLPAGVAWSSGRRWLAATLAVAAAGLVDYRLAALAAAALLTALVLRRGRSSAVVNRWGDRSRRKSGVASTLDVARIGSAHAMRRKAPVVRPSLAALPLPRRARLATTEVAVPLARVGGQRVWASVEDVVLTIGAPRTGKSVWLTGRIIDAPGACLVTSTRTDLHDLTAGLRAKRGPVYVFNAGGLGGIESSVTFDPLTGCADPVTATQRATDMLGGVGGEGGEAARWRELAEGALSLLMHAAALGGLSMRTVSEWVSDANLDGEAHREVTSLLRRSPEPGYVAAAEAYFNNNERTRTSITTTIGPALRWLMSPTATAAAEGGAPFDVARLLRQRATIYVLGAKEAHTAPLLAALTGHIAREARHLAARAPGGRLDPPLTLALDEAGLICPVPLPDWTSDMGGRGVTILAAFQSRAQMVNTWGPTGAAVILSNAAALMVFGGGHDYDDLEHWSKLAGERDEDVTTRDHGGRVTSRSTRKVAVISAAQLAHLPDWRVVIYRRGMLPVIATVAHTWKRRDVRAQARADKRAQRASATTTTHPYPGDVPGRPHAGDDTRPAGDRAGDWVTAQHADHQQGGAGDGCR
ncbi:MAG: TraM recognition domain-containing protein [Pseudonocardiaceae bacterium]|nr:TraM recognition domain-containing protein [Pseudonocardiaceae bacterium]